MNPTQDNNFDAAIIMVTESEGINYGFTPSAYHVQVEHDLDTNGVFCSAEGEYSFYALVEQIKSKLMHKTDPQVVFAAVAERMLRSVAYTFDVGRWLAIINAMIVGRDEYMRVNGHMPVDTSAFVMAYCDQGSAAVTNGIAY